MTATMTVTDERTKVKRGEQLIQPIPLELITTSHNPRWPVRVLQENLEAEGYGEFTTNPLGLVHILALSADPDKRAEFVRLCEKYEGESRQVVELAASRRKFPLQAIALRQFRVLNREKSVAGNNVYDTHYGLISGERRLLAAAYNHAKHGDSPTIGATVQEMTVEEAEDLAFDENVQRQDMQPLEVADWIRHKYDHNRLRAKEANITYKLKNFAEERGLDYQYASSRYNLTFLPEPLKEKVRQRKLGITEGAKIGREIKNGNRSADGKPKLNESEEIKGYKNKRQRARNLSELQKHFDEVRDTEAKDFLRGLSYAMNMSLRDADRESKRRLQEAA